MTDLDTRNTATGDAHAALGFTCETAIRAGLLDPWLTEIWRAVRYRRMILDRSRTPTIPLPAGQLWIWVHDQVYYGGPVEPPGHWEPAGTGAVIPDEDELRRSLGRPTRKDPTHA